MPCIRSTDQILVNLGHSIPGIRNISIVVPDIDFETRNPVGAGYRMSGK